jgi:hypothetical protein
MPFSPAAADLIRKWRLQRSQEICIRFRTASDNRSREFELFLQEFAECAGNIEIVSDKGEPGEWPALLVASNVAYYALPYDHELAPFLELLTYSLGEPAPLEEAFQDRLVQIVWPAELKVFIAAACPHCPEVVKKLSPLPFHQPLLNISIIDGILFPEISDPVGVRAVPTVLLDEQFRWTGSIDMLELLDTLVHRDAALLPVNTLKNLLKEGHADQLAAMILERGEVFPAFVDLVTHPEWSVRLGAVVVAEELTEMDPMLARRILPSLWERFDAADMTVKGDILYVVGLASSEEWAPRLRELLGTDLPEDLRESVLEILARW